MAAKELKSTGDTLQHEQNTLTVLAGGCVVTEGTSRSAGDRGRTGPSSSSCTKQASQL